LRDHPAGRRQTPRWLSRSRAQDIEITNTGLAAFQP
jgi:hypothetical protein